MDIYQTVLNYIVEQPVLWLLGCAVLLIFGIAFTIAEKQ